MSAYKFIVMTNATPGNEEEFNRWYNEQHVPDMLAIPGFVSGARFKMSASQAGFSRSDALQPYLAIYEIESDNIAATVTDLQARTVSGAFPITYAIDAESAVAAVYEPV